LIRIEHVRCRYGVFKVRANSIARPSRGRAPTGARSLKTQQRAAGSRENRHVKRGRRYSRRTGSSDDFEHKLWSSTSPAASGVRAPDSLERR